MEADYYIASGNSTTPIEVTAVMLDGGVIELRWNGSVLRGGNHRPQLLAEALRDWWRRRRLGSGAPTGDRANARDGQ